MNVLPSGRFRAPVDGGHIAYRIAGQGVPVATTHPYATPKAGHGPAPGFTTITIWPRGFGDSAEARDNSDYGFWRLSEDLDAVRQHLGLHTWSFWGTSMGGFVGLIYALQFPDTLSALILDSTAPSHHYKDDPSSVYPTLRASDAFRNLPRVEDHLFPCIDLEYGEDVGVKPIVPLVRFVAEPFGAVNFNAFHDASYRQG